MKPYVPKKILIEEEAFDSPITSHILQALPDTPRETISSAEELVETYKRLNPSVPRAKDLLVLANFKGRFFKACPGQQSKGETKNVCCDYFVINFASNCHMECTYCYLQSYLNFPYMIVYTNLDDLLTELDEVFTSQPQRFFRVGTGELADSLALDPITGFSPHLVNFFAAHENALLELKTKSNYVEKLLDLDHRGRTVVAWSVNPPFLQRTEEFKTSSIEERLEAATLCTSRGYGVAFHFDPMIHYPDWRSGYSQLIEEIARRIPHSQISWISLGGLRMPPGQKEIIKERFPRSRVPYGELVPAEDGKLRYFKPIRVDLYSTLLSWIGEAMPSVKVYACMERPEVWKRSFGQLPESDEILGQQLVGLTGG